MDLNLAYTYAFEDTPTEYFQYTFLPLLSLLISLKQNAPKMVLKGKILFIDMP
jgi:hypothetical protein